MRQGQAKLIIISNNCPQIRRTELEYYAMLSKSLVHHFDGNNIELGNFLFLLLLRRCVWQTAQSVSNYDQRSGRLGHPGARLSIVPLICFLFHLLFLLSNIFIIY